MEAEPVVTEPENLKQTAEEPGTTISVEPASFIPKLQQLLKPEDSKKSKDDQYSSDNLLDKQVKQKMLNRQILRIWRETMLLQLILQC